MTANQTLSIPNALRAARPEDYRDAATIEWPSDAEGRPLTIEGDVVRAVIFDRGQNVAQAKEFVRFLVADGGLAAWASSAQDRFLPPMPGLVARPFWLDAADPHRLRAAVQTLSWPHAYLYSTASGNWRHRMVTTEGVWPKAIHSVAAEGFTPEQAVDEAIVRIKQILGE